MRVGHQVDRTNRQMTVQGDVLKQLNTPITGLVVKSKGWHGHCQLGCAPNVIYRADLKLLTEEDPRNEKNEMVVGINPASMRIVGIVAMLRHSGDG
jgi:hypothetical protein